MNFDEFKEKVVFEIRRKVPEANVEIQEVLKNNDVKLSGLIILRPDKNISPSIYLEGYYREMCNGKDFSQIIREIWQVYLWSVPERDVDISDFAEWKQAKEKIVVRLINYERNKDLLETVPYDRFLNLAVVYSYIMEIDERGAATILVTNQHMQMWGICKNELNEIAYMNYKREHLVVAKSIGQLMNEFLGMPADMADEVDFSPIQMYVVTNQFKRHGATTMLFPEELRRLADEWHSDLYILPSSCHELMVLPKHGCNVQELKQMVCEANSETVAISDQLSDSVYCYLRESGEVSIALE